MPITFSSPDQRFGIVLEDLQLRALLDYAGKAGNDETGGVLVGHYNRSRNLAIITDVLGPTPDSRAGATWFVRGVKGIYEYLKTIWSNGNYYLGEWHFHPDAVAEPSRTDINHMEGIARSIEYACPEPILLILGGRPKSSWHFCAYQFLRGKKYFRMEQ